MKSINLNNRKQSFGDFIEKFQEAVKTHDRVKVLGVGVFIITAVEGGRRITPFGGDEMILPAYKRIRFKPSRQLKEAIK